MRIFGQKGNKYGLLNRSPFMNLKLPNMMRLKFTLLAMILAGWTSFSAIAQTSDLPVYTIYIGPFVETTANDFQIFNNLGFPYALSAGSNMYKVYMGGYTKQGDADQAATTLRQRGYTDAAVLMLNPALGQQVPVIQLGTKVLGQTINWNEFNKVGPLNVMLQDKSVKITTGVYPDMATAQTQLAEIRKMGFQDAFLKTVNTVFLHEINAFYPAAIYTPPPPAPAPAPAQAGQTARTVPQEVPQAYNTVSTIPPAAAVPAPYSQPAAPAYRPLPPVASKAAAKPAIRPNVKRNSAFELQKLLKETGFMSTGLDGYYGKGTAVAFDAAFKSNPRIQGHLAQESTPSLPGTLQYAIDMLADNPAEAIPTLEASKFPVARAYLAYYYLATEGPSMKVNDLINGAVMETYAKAVRPARTRFDYTSMYSYANAEQLITPLAYVQVVSATAVTTPCWLIQRHPEAAANAFTPDPALPKAYYGQPECGGFFDWPETRTLVDVAREICGSPQPADKIVAEGRARSRELMLQPKALPTIDQTVATAWHAKMVTGLSNWSETDPMLKEMANSFKLLYFQSYVLLEDYYMDKGLNATDAKNLAIATLRGLVGPYLDRFI